MGTTLCMPKVAVVVTTIGEGQFLGDYYRAAIDEGVLDRVSLIVIPDRKTPAALFRACEDYKRRGLNLVCPSLDEQDSYLSRLGLNDFIPYNSDNRRNIGYLMALESGCDYVVSIDDDNYRRPGESFFHEHAIVCEDRVEAPSVSSDIGWFNICSLLETGSANVWPRGTPYRYRHADNRISTAVEAGAVRLNAGLWLAEPDLDAMTWLTQPVRATAAKGPSVLLGRDTWSPINTQNTSLHRDVIVAYYFLRMGYPVGTGMVIDRYGDIFSGYFCQACVRHMGHRIRVGTPLVDHRRNSHNYLKDAVNEMGAICMIEDVADWLRTVKLDGRTYAESYQSLVAAIDDAADGFRGAIWTDASRRCLNDMAACMRRWVTACAALS